MHLGLRLLFAFLAITGLAAFFVLRVFVTEIKPSVGEVMEDLMVDTAHLLAELAAPELAGGGALADGPFARAVRTYSTRAVDARIWGLHKTTLDLRVTLTDPRGIVVFDSGTPSQIGQDHSRWRDVARTLRGEYGARTSPEGPGLTSVMVVAAPVRQGEQLLGVMVVAKPLATVAPFIERAENKVLAAGLLLLGLSLAIGAAVTLWTVRSVRSLRRYALQVGDMPRAAPAPQAPQLPGELGELARAMEQMRQRLEGREQIEQQVRALTHELKSPLAAIRGAAELLQDPIADADRRRFAMQIDGQAQRLHQLVEQVLELSKLETLQALPSTAPVDLVALSETVLADHEAALQQRGLRVEWTAADRTPVHGDAARLRLAISNLLANALAHAPSGSAIELRVNADGPGIEWSLRDQGPGVPDYALPQLGQRFYTAAAADAPRGSGLGLAIVRQVALLHGAVLSIANSTPGLRVSLHFPRR